MNRLHSPSEWMSVDVMRTVDAGGYAWFVIGATRCVLLSRQRTPHAVLADAYELLEFAVEPDVSMARALRDVGVHVPESCSPPAVDWETVLRFNAPVEGPAPQHVYHGIPAGWTAAIVEGLRAAGCRAMMNTVVVRPLRNPLFAILEAVAGVAVGAGVSA